MTKQFAASASSALCAMPVSSHTFDGPNSSSRREATRWSLSWGQRAVAFAAALLLTGAIGATAQAPILEPNWNQLSPATSAPERYITALTYDATHNQAVLFGGFGASGYINDTWLWNGATWIQANPSSSPSARAGAAMAYDAASGNVVLFGGLYNGSTRYNDTWIWNGTNWTQVSPATVPPGRASGSMVYDAALGEIVMFGGVSTGGFDIGDTWVWNGTNWASVTTAHSPSARDQYGMVYDPVNQVVVLFGGSSNGTDENDTWTFNGTDWTQQSPGTSPPARGSAAMAYDAALGETVMWGGNNGTYLSDTWVWNGSTWAQLTTATSPAGRYADNGMVYDAAQNQLLLFGGLDSSQQFSDTWEFGLPQNFGSVNVCPSGQTTPAPCSNTLTLTYNIASTTTFGTTKVVTQGASSLDFSPASGSTCIGTVNAGSSCTVNVTFAAQAAGLRAGAVELFASGPTPLVTTPIYGIGEAPVAAFSPLQSYVRYLGGASLLGPKGVALDASNDVFIADTGNARVLELVGNNTNLVGSGLSAPQGLAIDGGGNLFIADSGLNAVVEVPANGGAQSVVYSGVAAVPDGLAVDGAGDLFIANSSFSQVVEISANGGGQTLLGSGWSQPTGLAVDAGGDLFVADAGIPAVVEIPAGCTNSVCQTTVGSGWSKPQSVVVDAAGDVIVADSGLNEVVEVPAGCTSLACQITLVSGVQSYGATVDPLGVVYYLDFNNSVLDEVLQQYYGFSFSASTVGNISGDSPRFVTLQNVGNQQLNAISPGLVFTDPDFSQVAGSGTPSDCNGSFLLVPGATCNLSVDFDPLSNGSLSGSAVFTDNALNTSPDATQTFTFSGTGTGGIADYSLTVTEPGTGGGTVFDNVALITCTDTGGSVTGSCSANYPSGQIVILTASAAAGSSFTGWGGACASAGTNPQCNVTMNAALNVSASFLQGNFAGVNVCPGGSTSGCTGSSQTVTFNFSGNTAVSQIQAVTQGITGLDFSSPNSGPCINTFTAGNSCTVNVTFKPTAPGLRMGAVNLLDNGGHVLATQLVYGIGQGSAVAFWPGTQTTVPTNGLHHNVGVALDGAGDLYIADYTAGKVVKVTPGGVQTTVPATGLSAPIGVAVDGAGDVFIVDLNLPNAVEVTPAGVQTAVGSGLSYPVGIAVDGAGDVFIGDQNNNRVVEVTPTGVQTTVPATGLQQPWGVAVDAAGDVFIADGGSNNRVVEVTPSGVQTTVPATGLQQPYDLAVDAAGDVFIADPKNARVLEVTPSGVQTTVGSGLNYPSGVTVDAGGDVFIGDQGSGEVFEVNTSTPVVNLGIVSQNYQSSDTPLSLQNIGNQTLTGSVGPVTGSYLFEDASASTCTNGGGFSLSPGASCVENFYSNTTTVGSISSTAVVTDNALNGSPATQTISISGLSLGATVMVTATGAGTGSGFVEANPTGINCNFLAGVASGTCSQSISTGLTLSIEEVPTAGSTFAGWGGACASAGTNQFCTVNVIGAATVSATFTSSLITDAVAVTELGSGAGSVTSSPTGISCSQAAGGGSSGTCGSNFAGGSQVTLTANPAAGSAFLGWGAPCSGASLTCTFTVNGPVDVGASFALQNFGGNVNVCPTGSTTPAPCSSSQTVTFSLAATSTIGAIQVVTQGVTGLDFTLSSGSTCTGVISGGNFCSVNVNFTPLAPGLRTGAVELFDNNGNLVATTAIYGIGQGPEAAFSPSTQIPVNTGSVPLSTPKGMLIDAAGNLFISDTGEVSGVHQVVKIAANGTETVFGPGLPTPLRFPQGMAEDGAGNLFIADNNLNAVVEIPAGCNSSCAQEKIVPNPLNLRSQLGVAVDGSGNLFVGDFEGNEVAEVPANGGAQTLVYNPTPGTCSTSNTTPCSHPIDLTTDAAGDLFVADFGLQSVVEVPAGCTSAGCQKSIGAGWSQPDGVAVDAAGDVFVADAGLDEVVEVPAGCTTSACQMVLVSGVNTVAVKLDSAGDLFVDNLAASQILEVTRSLPPSLSFALTNVGNTSVDSPQAVTVQNVGNQPLTGSVGATSTASFAKNPASTCGTFTLAPGALCSEGFSFTPQGSGILNDTASFSDNTLNLASSVALQTVNINGIGSVNGQTGTAVPNVVGMPEGAAATTLTDAGLTLGTVNSEYSNNQPAGSVIGESPAAGAPVNLGSPVALLISTGEAPAPAPNPLTFENNYFVTGDFATAGVSLRGAGSGGVATKTINIPDSTSGGTQGVPDGADIVAGFLYWETLENTVTPSGNTGTFLGYPITGLQIGSDLPYTDSGLSGTLRVYRADVNAYFQVSPAWNGARLGSGPFTVTLPDSGQTGSTGKFPLNEGASLVVIYRALSTNVPLKSVVIYDGSAIPTSSTTQNVQGFYDAVGGTTPAEVATLYAAGGNWNSGPTPVTSLGADASQYTVNLNSGSAYAAVIFSTPVANSDNDGILNAWKNGPPAGDFFAGQPGYYDLKTQSWVPLPGAKHGEKDLFVQLDYMCGAVLSNGQCDPAQENLFPSPDSDGKDPLLMVQQAFASTGIVLHLEIGNAVPESICTDSAGQLCQFPGEPGVIGWKNSLEFSKLWPRNFTSCAGGGDCTARFPYGQKDSYHYVLFGHSLAIPAWNTRFGTLSAITASSSTGQTTITTSNRGAQGSINYCPSRFTLSGIISNPSLNGVYSTVSCPDAQTIILATPGVANWNYSYAANTPPEPEIGLTSGTVTSISGYSDLGGADSAVTLALWETAPNQDMSKRAQVVAGTLFHEIGHTLGLGHGGLYYNGGTGNYVPTFDVNCKPNYQSSMNYLFQLDGVGPNAAVAYSNQTLESLTEASLSGVASLLDINNNPATFSTSSWYTDVAPSSTATPATLHCDGTPLTGDTGYRVNGSIAPPTPAWSSSADPNIAFDGVSYGSLLGYNDVANIDLRQVGATGGEFASLANILNFGSSSTPLNIASGGNVSVGAGGTATVGTGGSVTLNNGGSVTVPGGAVINGGGTITFTTGASATVSANATVTPGKSGVVALPSGGSVTLNTGGTITMGGGGTIAMGGGGNITMGGGGSITLPGVGGTVTIPSAGGAYIVPAGGTVTLNSGGSVTLASGTSVTVGGSGTIAMGGGGNITMGGGGTIAMGGGGTITMGGGGTIAMGGGGNITMGGGGSVTVGGGGNLSLGAGGNVTLAAGGSVTLSSGGTITVNGGGAGNITMGGGGTIARGGCGNITMGGGGNITLGTGGGSINGTPRSAGYSTTVSSGGTISLSAGGSVTVNGGAGNITMGGGGNITMGGGGTITMGGGGNITMGGGGAVTLGGAGANVTLGGGGSFSLGGGGTVTMGGGGTTTNEMDYSTANSFVRPPPAATYSVAPANTVQVNWTAPAFGVVQSYTISRSVLYSNGTVDVPPAVIGTVSGANGFPPATTFTDTTPPTPPTGGSVVYTIATTLVPDVVSSTPRSSAPSPPAVLTLNQTIVLGSLPGSVTISSSTPSTVPITATAETNSSPNGLQVSFGTTGPCSIVSGSQSVTPVVSGAGGVSSATVTLNSTGTCTITASQAGDSTAQSGATAYSAATPVSGTFTILPQGSTAQPQTITFGPLSSVQYGSSFSVSATSNVGATVSVSAPASGKPCTLSNVTSVGGTTTASGTITGVGSCTIMASAPSGTGPSNSTYSAASVSQSFSVYPAVINVTAASYTIPYGQTLPTLTYALSGFVNNDPISVVTGTPLLSTTATSTSNPSIYPITVTTGSLAATNYSFNPVSGTLAIKAAGTTTAASSQTASYSPNSQSVALSATVTSTTGTVSGGTVTFTVLNGTTPVGTATTSSAVTSGTASVSYALPAGTASGSYAIQAVYNGATNFSGSSDNTHRLTINAAGTTTAASSQTASYSPNSQSVALSATVTSTTGTVSGGTVTFTVLNGTTPVGTATTSSAVTSGTASVSYTLPAGTAGGTYTIQAVYNGTTSFSGSSDNTHKLTINAGPIITVSPSSINFGAVTLNSITTKTVTVSNTGNAAATVSTPRISLLQAGNSNEFVVVNLCPSSLAAGKSCTIAVSFVAGAYYNTLQTATLQIMDNAPGSPQPVALSATVLEPQTITFSVSPPASAVYNSSFTVAASASSGLGVTFTSSGPCSNSGAKYTMTSGIGTCSVIANQAGSSAYAAAPQVTKSVTATLAAQSITFTASPPASAVYNSGFTVAASASSGLGVTFTSSGSCSNSGAKYTMTSGTGTCSVIANQAGNSNYAAAAQVTKPVTSTLAAQTITFTTSALAKAVYKSSFTVAAAASSGLAVSYTSSGACSNSGATYTMTSGAGTCSVIAKQAGNSNYSAAPQVTQTVTAAYSAATLSPTSMSFGTVSSGKSSTAQTATLSNTGTMPLIISSIGFAGTNPGNFTQTNTCPSSSSSLAAGAKCTISVTFNSSGKAATANLTVTDNTSAGTQTVSLSGN